MTVLKTVEVPQLPSHLVVQFLDKVVDMPVVVQRVDNVVDVPVVQVPQFIDGWTSLRSCSDKLSLEQ